MALGMVALEQQDPEVAGIIRREEERERDALELIASEHYASAAVQEAVGSALTNKYAEGYPGHRYYSGCGIVDEAELLAISRAKRLFKAEHANVQSHSGAEANMAAYFSLMELGDPILSMSLSQGGHVTHGLSVNYSAWLYRFVHYGVERETGLIDYDQMRKLAHKHGPKVILVGATAYPRTIDFARAREIADEVGAYLMVDMAHIAGLVAAGVHPSPVPYADVVTSTTHKTLRGPRSAFILSKQSLGQRVDRAVFPGTQGGAHMHVIGGKAVCFAEAMRADFVEYGRAIVRNAAVLAEELNSRGLRLVSGGTDNHLILVDVGAKGITGRDADRALESVGIFANKNAIPYDERPPTVASGLRLGTPALTSRGFGPREMREIAGLITDVLDNLDDERTLTQIRRKVKELARAFPAPGVPTRQ